jgi:hypothetical protein
VGIGTAGTQGVEIVVVLYGFFRVLLGFAGGILGLAGVFLGASADGLDLRGRGNGRRGRRLGSTGLRARGSGNHEEQGEAEQTGEAIEAHGFQPLGRVPPAYPLRG